MTESSELLPDVPIYGFIGGIPESFGGRTGVCLQRANTFAELDDRDVEILTLSPAHSHDPEAVTQRLRDEGRIGDRVTIRNFWADLRRASDEDLRLMSKYSVKSRFDDPGRLLPYSSESVEELKDSEGNLLQSDRFRDDGSRVSSHRTDVLNSHGQTSKMTTIFSHEGEPIGQWKALHELYFSWMDWIFAGRKTVLINDGPPLARYLHKYQRDNVIFLQTIHSRHSSDPKSAAGRLSVVYRPTLMHMDSFDRVVVLTESQHDDLVARNLGSDKLVVVPNIADLTPEDSAASRPVARGVMLAKITKLKRIDRAIRAVDLARRQGTPAELDIFGAAGDASEQVEGLLRTLESRDSIRLRGFDTNAKSRFAQASFTLLTSKYEGMPMVLLEAMAAGCIPIAYDIDYGPSDIISDGVNGFLVPNGDIEAMADRISHLASLDATTVAEMREAAQRRTKDFAPEIITQRWGQVMREAIASKAPATELKGQALLKSLSSADDTFRLELSLRTRPGRKIHRAVLVWEEREGLGFGRVPGTVKRRLTGTSAEFVLPASEFDSVATGIVDIWVDLYATDGHSRLRVKGVDPKAALPASGRIRPYGTKYQSLSARVK
ncbi:glycosyltransferase [Brevibacterium permense]|uniref:glycosyltransferase n=1 Tax=Brevibacterium permense TaxID=234834 RepID=UPI0021D19FE4|nr:glycosyltransferase [Brevibacterium permense]